jgi:hypothetical protein
LVKRNLNNFHALSPGVSDIHAFRRWDVAWAGTDARDNAGRKRNLMSNIVYANLESTHKITIETSYIAVFASNAGFESYTTSGLAFVVGAETTASLGSSSTATLVLINRNSEQGQQVYQVHLKNTSDGGEEPVTHWIGDIVDPVSMFGVSEDGSPTFYHPQIALVVDGVWQVDPIQQGDQHNFNFAWQFGT